MMPTQQDAAAVPVAWNGVRLSVPASWHVVRLGLGYLAFEDGDGPVFEIKWRRGAGREGMDAALRALTPKGRATAGEALPGSWLDVLADFELMSLSWRRDAHVGRGAALFCPECGMAAVVQAYAGPDGLDARAEAVVAAVLASFVHHDPPPPAFALYGFACTPPAGFSLGTFSFAPGRFALSFAARRARLDVLRLAPAEVLLAGSDLATLAARLFGFASSAGASSGTVAGCPAVWLSKRQGTGLGQRLARLAGRPGQLAVLRHEVAGDKLIGLALTAAKPVDPVWLAEVAARCVSL